MLWNAGMHNEKNCQIRRSRGFTWVSGHVSRGSLTHICYTPPSNKNLIRPQGSISYCKRWARVSPWCAISNLNNSATPKAALRFLFNNSVCCPGRQGSGPRCLVTQAPGSFVCMGVGMFGEMCSWKPTSTQRFIVWGVGCQTPPPPIMQQQDICVYLWT